MGKNNKCELLDVYTDGSFRHTPRKAGAGGLICNHPQSGKKRVIKGFAFNLKEQAAEDSFDCELWAVCLTFQELEADTVGRIFCDNKQVRDRISDIIEGKLDTDVHTRPVFDELKKVITKQTKIRVVNEVNRKTENIPNANHLALHAANNDLNQLKRRRKAHNAPIIFIDVNGMREELTGQPHQKSSHRQKPDIPAEKPTIEIWTGGSHLPEKNSSGCASVQKNVSENRMIFVRAQHIAPNEGKSPLELDLWAFVNAASDLPDNSIAKLVTVCKATPSTIQKIQAGKHSGLENGDLFHQLKNILENQPQITVELVPGGNGKNAVVRVFAKAAAKNNLQEIQHQWKQYSLQNAVFVDAQCNEHLLENGQHYG